MNAIIRTVVAIAADAGIEVFGVSDGFLGLIENRVRRLVPTDVADILARGGTILGASNKSDPRRHVTGRHPDGSPIFENVLDRCLARIADHRLEALLVIGGDGSLMVAQAFTAAGVNCIGIPKTIDNDVRGTDLAVGFLTAVTIATEALDRVRTTAASHHRVIAVEVMGRHTGWIALWAGIAAGADVILIPEIPFTHDHVARAVLRRRDAGQRFSIICVAEGAAPAGGCQAVARLDPASPDPVRFGGIAQQVAQHLESATGIESRYVVLGHVQRGGPPVPQDRILATLLGHHAMSLLHAGARNRLAAIRDNALADVDLAIPAQGPRRVPRDDPLIAAGRALGVSFGDG